VNDRIGLEPTAPAWSGLVWNGIP